ncbi:MAG: PilX N-terminal domain-containing pilus assembly protein [Vulcanimicrobiota bacterium]
MRRKITERGIALALVLIIILILAVLGSGISSTGVRIHNLSREHSDSAGAFYAAETGVARGIKNIADNPTTFTESTTYTKVEGTDDFYYKYAYTDNVTGTASMPGKLFASVPAGLIEIVGTGAKCRVNGSRITAQEPIEKTAILTSPSGGYHVMFNCALYVGNEMYDPNYTFTLGGTASSHGAWSQTFISSPAPGRYQWAYNPGSSDNADAVHGRIHVNGNVALEGNATVTGNKPNGSKYNTGDVPTDTVITTSSDLDGDDDSTEHDIGAITVASGASVTGLQSPGFGVLLPPDLAGMNYPTMSTRVDVATEFAGTTESKPNNSGEAGMATSVTTVAKTNPAHIFCKDLMSPVIDANTDDTKRLHESNWDSSDGHDAKVIIPSMTKDMYYLGDWQNGSTGSTIRVYSTGQGKIYFVDGNLTIDSGGYGPTIYGPSTSEGAQITVVVRGNIYIGDQIDFQSNNKTGALVLVALNDGETYTDLNHNNVRDMAYEPFSDTDGDGDYDAPEPFTDTNSNGVRDSGETLSTDRDRDGIYDAKETYTDRNRNRRYDTGEPFTDLNGNGVYNSTGDSYVDSNGNGSWDPPETYTDLNGNGKYTLGETFIDTNGNGSIDCVMEPFVDKNGNSVYDGAKEGSGNIFFGDMNQGPLCHYSTDAVNAFMYAENNFYEIAVNANSSSQEFTINGLMSAGNKIITSRDHNGNHVQMVLNYDDRLEHGNLTKITGLPPGVGLAQFAGMTPRAWIRK